MIKKLLCRHNFKIRHNFLNNLKVVNVVCNDVNRRALRRDER